MKTISISQWVAATVNAFLRRCGAGAVPMVIAFGCLLLAIPARAQVTQTIGDLAPGKSVTIKYDVTINSPLAVGVTQISHQGSVSGNNFTTVNTDDPETATANDATITALAQDFDFGDAPDPTYPTLLANNGARHFIPAGGATLYLGSVAPDAESDGQPNATATGDGADEDGVSLPASILGGQGYTVTVVVTGSGGLLNAWLDWNRNGSWNDVGDHIITDLSLSAGSHAINLTAPSFAGGGTTFARFRLSTQSGLAPTGQAPDGEVEDYTATLVVNTAPVANNDSYSVTRGGTLNQTDGRGTVTPANPNDNGVLANDTDADGDTLTAILVSGPAHAASFNLNADGSFTYVHDGSASTSDSFTYKANDGLVDSGVATVSITILQGPATHFAVSAPASATAGSAFTFTVTAQDAFNNTVTGYAGTVHFTSADGQAVLPANSTLASGVGTFSATLKTAGSQTITATDTAASSITGSASMMVNPAAATHFSVSAPASATAGSAFSFTVTALDQFNNTATGYAGTAHFTSSDGQAVLPGNSTLASGVGTFSATLKTAGNRTITATDTAVGSITGSASVTVNAAAATHFTVSAPASATAGSAFSFTVTALDQFNNTATGYAGTVHFTSSDGQAVLPANSTLTSGVGTFSATLKTAGSQTITATDTANSSITGTSNSIGVSAAAATHFAVSTPASATAGSAFSFTVTAQDQFNNTATGYAGTVHFTCSDGQSVLPANSALASGVGTFSATLKTAGTQTITATDTVSSSITGGASMTVNAATATHFAVSAPGTPTAGSAFTFTVTAQDQFNNTATSYGGTVHFTSSDGQAVLPANSTLASGVGTFSATLKTVGLQTISATDTASSSVTGTSNLTWVSPAAATHFAVSAPASATAGAAFSFTVTAQDEFNNRATGYVGTVHFTSSDGQALLPANATLTSAGTFSARLKTAGTQTITATDAASSSVTGTSDSILVSPAAATNFAVSASGSATPGVAFSFTVTAQDAFNNTATGYAGTVHFTSSDGAASLPANYTFLGADAGVHAFNATLNTLGPQTIAATDTAASSITGTSSPINVGTTCPTITATVSGGGTICAGGSSTVTVTMSGGAAPYTVTLDNGGGTLTGGSPLNFSVSPASTTTFHVAFGHDNSNCPVTQSGSATVTSNAPPFAGQDSLGTKQNTAASVAIPKLLANDSSPIAGPLSITGVNSPSAQSGTVALGAGVVTYTPANNFSGTDTFTYTLSDGRCTAQGTVLVTVSDSGASSLNEVSIVHTTNPSANVITFAGIPGSTYVIQWAASLTLPVSWADLSPPIVADPTGLITYTDSSPPSPRFYRTRVSP